MRCDECEHWDFNAKHPEDRQMCNKALFAGDFDGYSVSEEEAMEVCDGSMYSATLYTRPDHYCAQFKERT